MEKFLGLILATLFAMFLPINTVFAATTYSDRGLFETTLGTTVTDNYENAGYPSIIQSNTAMSAVIGETDYQTTAFLNSNIVNDYGTGNNIYCGGCNGTFELGFTTTSVGSTDGVFGVGFNYRNNVIDPYLAFVTFGDNTTENYALLANNDLTTYFGLTSNLLVKSVHFGLTGGGDTYDGNFQIDNLTIGSISTIPLPSALPLYGAGLIILGITGHRRRRK